MAKNISTKFEREVYEKYYPLVRSTCMRRLHQKDSIEDAIQSTFLLYIRDQAKVKSNLSSWLYWASVNVCKVINGDLKKHSKNILEETTGNVIDPIDQNYICLDKLMASLPMKKREILLMKYYDNMSNKEIAEKIKSKETSVKKAIERTLSLLQTKFNKKDVLVTALLSQFFYTSKASAVETNTSSFILQNSITQQSIVKGVLNMYLLKKVSLACVLFLCFSFTSSYFLFALDKKEAIKESHDVSKDTKKDSSEKPKVIWTAYVGSNSFSATIPVMKGRHLLFSGREELYCLDKSKGKVIWKIRGMFNHSMPIFWKNKVVAVAKNGLHIIGLKTGNVEAKIDLSSPGFTDFVVGCDLIIRDDHCYLGTRTNYLMKIDLTAKKVVWKSKNQDYVVDTPALEGKRAAVSVWTKSICVFDTTSGKRLWKKDFPNIGAYPPIIQNGIVISGGCIPKAKKNISGGGVISEEQDARQVIRTGTIPVVDQAGLVQAFKISDGHLLWSKTIEYEGNQSCLGLLGTEKGLIVGTKSLLLSLDAKTGKEQWKYPRKRFGYQNYTLDKRGKLYLGTDESAFVMLDLASGKECKVFNLMNYLNKGDKSLRRGSRHGVKFQDAGACSTPLVENNYAYVQTTTGLAICISMPDHLFQE